MERMFMVVVVAVLVALMYCYQSDFHTRYNVWADRCVTDKGVVMILEKTFRTTRYACIRDGAEINRVD